MKKSLSSAAFVIVFAMYTIFRIHSSASNILPVSVPISGTSTTSATRITPTVKIVPTIQHSVVSTATQQKTPMVMHHNSHKGPYIDGTYTGPSADAYYGFVKIRATVINGAISNVTFLSHPHDLNTSRMINNYVMPILRSEALTVQTARVNTISGATETSRAFRSSLASALRKAS